MIDNPDSIEELVTLDRILKANKFSLAVYDLPADFTPRFGIQYSFSVLGKNGGLGSAFQKAAEELVTPNGGKIGLQYSSGGFSALFSDEDKRTEFLKGFSRAAGILFAPPLPQGIKKIEEGFVLGDSSRLGI